MVGTWPNVWVTSEILCVHQRFEDLIIILKGTPSSSHCKAMGKGVRCKLVWFMNKQRRLPLNQVLGFGFKGHLCVWVNGLITMFVRLCFLSEHTCWVWIGYRIYHNEAHSQRYVNLKFYIIFITVNICKKYPYSNSNMFWNPSKINWNKYDLTLIFVNSIN